MGILYTRHNRIGKRGQTMVEYGILGATVILMAIGGLTVLGPPFANAVRQMTDQGGGATRPGIANVQPASTVNATGNPYDASYGAVNTASGTYGGGDTQLTWSWDGNTLNGGQVGQCDPPIPGCANYSGGF